MKVIGNVNKKFRILFHVLLAQNPDSSIPNDVVVQPKYFDEWILNYIFVIRNYKAFCIDVHYGE